VVFGDFGACYRLYRVGPPIFVRDPYSGYGVVEFYYEQRYYGAIADGDAVKLIKCATS
jgi:predicted phage gp36 major capsid-like protein